MFFEEGILNRIPAAIYTMGYYIRLLIFPHPLSYYYGFDYIPVGNWTSTDSIRSVVIYFILGFGIVCAGIYAILRIRKKEVLTFGILFYLFAIAGFANLVVPVVGIIGDRFT